MDEQERERREEMLRRLDSADEMTGRSAVGRDPDEDERLHEFANEAEKASTRGLGLSW